MKLEKYQKIDLLCHDLKDKYEILCESYFEHIPKLNDLIKEDSNFFLIKEYIQNKPDNRYKKIDEEFLFELVDFFNSSIDSLDKKRKTELALLNIKASRYSKKLKNYDTAKLHSNYAKQCLCEDCWSEEYDLSVDVYLDFLESLYYENSFEKAEKMYKTIESYLIDDLSKLVLYKIQFMQYHAQNRIDEAFDIAQKIVPLVEIKKV